MYDLATGQPTTETINPNLWPFTAKPGVAFCYTGAVTADILDTRCYETTDFRFPVGHASSCGDSHARPGRRTPVDGCLDFERECKTGWMKLW